jgi:3-oxoacyl-[acyl-carrier-protein] synthase II
MRNREREVWITGVGCATPLGHNLDELAANLLAGRSAIRKITGWDVSKFPSQIGGQLDAVPCPTDFDETEFRTLSRLEQLVHYCCTEALRDSGWWDGRGNLRIGLVLGLGAEWLVNWETDGHRGGHKVLDVLQDTPSLVHITQRKLGFNGPAISVSAACASGNFALAQARRWLELDWVDVCLAGACDMWVTPLSLAGFGNLRALSKKNADPQHASRPFDKHRDGFVLSEGGAMFVLEAAADARQRGAKAYAHIAGCGARSDAHHMVIPSTNPEPASQAMRLALADAQVNPGDIDYINAHATSTPIGDAAEARILHAVLGNDASKVPVSSTKSMTGHLLTAAAAVEALIGIIALQRNAIPPTINLEEIDPECAHLCHVPQQAREQPVNTAVSNSFGFGGSNTCLVLKKVA